MTSSNDNQAPQGKSLSGTLNRTSHLKSTPCDDATTRGGEINAAARSESELYGAPLGGKLTTSPMVRRSPHLRPSGSMIRVAAAWEMRSAPLGDRAPRGTFGRKIDDIAAGETKTTLSFLRERAPCRLGPCVVPHESGWTGGGGAGCLVQWRRQARSRDGDKIGWQPPVSRRDRNHTLETGRSDVPHESAQFG